MTTNHYSLWLNQFGKTIYFEVLVAATLITFIGLQIVNTYSIWNHVKYYDSYVKQLDNAKQRTKSLISKVDYLNSPEYKDENIKNQGYKYPSEQVWELNQKEVSRVSKNQLDMIKYPVQSSFGNFDRWLLCLNLTDRNSFWIELEAKKLNLTVDNNQNKPLLNESNLCKKSK